MLTLTERQARNLVVRLRGRGGLTDEELRRMLGCSQDQYRTLLMDGLRSLARKMVKLDILGEIFYS